MGEVYRARDTKLGREVAIKVLPEEFSKDNIRLQRFEREAKLLASLDHSTIASGSRQLIQDRTMGPRQVSLPGSPCSALATLSS